MKKRRAAEGYAIFSTAIGPCGVAWSQRGLVSIQLPEETAEATRARLWDRITLPEDGGSTKRIPFNYRKAGEGSERDNFFVRPGDIIFVP